MKFNDTISAISTPPGTGGIGIIRVSGNDSIEIVDKIYKGISGKKLKDTKTHTINYGHIINTKKDQVIDEVLVMLMKSPKTFTTEDVVEIHCHGGSVPVEQILLATLEAGARLADSGEFTKRAFLNGRIDLSQAEAVIDIIDAKTDKSLYQAVGQLEGTLSKMIKEYQNELLEIIANIEVSIDYPEYDTEDEPGDDYKESIGNLRKKMIKLLNTADTGTMIKEGVRTAIVGKPNVGKSSILNTLLEDNKAIVTDIPGTTRDVVEAYLNIEGIPFKLLDTAGIRDSGDEVEKIGVEKSLESIQNADLVIMLLDISDELTNEDLDIFEKVKDKNTIYILNKKDLKHKISQAIIKEHTGDNPVIKVSTLNNDGIEDLKDRMKSFVSKGKASISNDVRISNIRHKDALSKAIASLDKVIEAIDVGMPEDCMAIDLHDAYGYLGMIIGETVREEIITELFTRFCLGK